MARLYIHKLQLPPPLSLSLSLSLHQVTSASNCTDYQSYRLNAMYPNPAKLTNPRAPGRKPVHTVSHCLSMTPALNSLDGYTGEWDLLCCAKSDSGSS